MFDIPSNLAEAKSLPESEHWEKAMQKEFELLEGCITWQLETPGQSVVGCMWIIAKKFDAEGNLS
jgi:hypothetical protein